MKGFTLLEVIIALIIAGIAAAALFEAVGSGPAPDPNSIDV